MIGSRFRRGAAACAAIALVAAAISVVGCGASDSGSAAPSMAGKGLAPLPPRLDPTALDGAAFAHEPCYLEERGAVAPYLLGTADVSCKDYKLPVGDVAVIKRGAPAESPSDRPCRRMSGSLRAAHEHVTAGGTNGFYYECKAQNRAVAAKMFADTLPV